MFEKKYNFLIVLTILFFILIVPQFFCKNTVTDKLEDPANLKVKTSFRASDLQEYKIDSTLTLEKFDAPEEIKKRIKDFSKLQLVGKLAVLAPSNTHGSCAMSSCHNALNDFNPEERHSVGKAGLFDMEMERYDTSVVVDLNPTVGSRNVVNSLYNPNALYNGGLGLGGVNVSIDSSQLIAFNKFNAFGYAGQPTQVFAGFNLHQIGSITGFFNAHSVLSQMFFEAVECDEITDTLMAFAISSYESEYLTYEAPFQKYLRGEIEESQLRNPKGKDIFFDNCTGCHNGPALGFRTRAAKIGKSNVGGLEDITGNPAHIGIIMSTGLYNIKNKKFLLFDNSLVNSGRKVVERIVDDHDCQNTDDLDFDLTDKELTDVTDFILYDLYDKNMSKRVFDRVR